VSTIEVRDVLGGVVGERELPAELFEGVVNVPLMHQVVVAGAAAQRSGTHSTKTRGDVRGGGVKPWRQKGTGRARQGSIRSPQWSGGGVAHGPHPHGWDMRVNKKMKKGALRSALSDALASGKLAVVETLAFAEPRTKDAVRVLSALGLTGKVLVVLSRPNEATEKSFRNLGSVRIDYPGNLSTYDLLYADRVLFTHAALAVLTGEDPEAEESIVELPALEPAVEALPEAVASAPVPEASGEPESASAAPSEAPATEGDDSDDADDADDADDGGEQA
jgi:large subunit ribosomal protein L4